jgi:hypothetical protein
MEIFYKSTLGFFEQCIKPIGLLLGYFLIQYDSKIGRLLDQIGEVSLKYSRLGDFIIAQ